MAYPDQEQEDNPEAGGEKLQSAAGTTLSGYSSPTGTAQDKQSGMHTNLQSYIDQNRSQTSDMATKAFMKPERQNILSGIATNMSGLEGSNEGLTQSQINQRLSPYESRIKEYPKVGDQLDAIWKQFKTMELTAETKIVADEIQAVKDKWPKPIEALAK